MKSFVLRDCPICGGEVSRDRTGVRWLAADITDLLADPLAWVFVFGGAAVAAQTSIVGAIAIVVAWVMALGISAHLVQYKCNKCHATLSFNGSTRTK